MKVPRLAIITRGFWPAVGGPEKVADLLAQQWHAAGGEVTVLTARLDPASPRQTRRQGADIVRLPLAGLRCFAERRYLRNLTAWLAEHRRRYDIIYVSRLRHEAEAAIAASRQSDVPVVLRAESAGLTGDCHWQLDARGGRRIKHQCFRADAVVAPSAGIERELIAAGYPRDRIHGIANGVSIPPPRTPGERQSARELLAEVDPTLGLPPETPLVVYAGRLHPAKSLDVVIRAWSAVRSEHPLARLWLVGEGQQRVALGDLVREADLADSIHFTGRFDGIEDVLRAADLFVLPSVEEGLSLALLEAMAAGLPVVATDIPGNNEAIDDRTHGRLVPAEDTAALGSAMVELLSAPEQAAEMGRQARRRVEKLFALETMVQRHLELFDTLTAD